MNFLYLSSSLPRRRICKRARPAKADTGGSRKRPQSSQTEHFIATRRSFSSLNKSYHPAPLYSIERVNDIISIEHSQQTLHRSRCIARTRLEVLAQNAPCVIKGANEGIMVGTIHERKATPQIRDSKLKPADSFRRRAVAWPKSHRSLASLRRPQ
jgi:hypothetical protein